MATPSLTETGNRSTMRHDDIKRAAYALAALNFFVADMQAGAGSFLGVFLQQHGWQTGPIGTVMTAGGVAGMIVTAPAGAFIDHTEKKRWVVVLASVCLVLASLLILWSQSWPVVAASQIAAAMAGAAIGPAIAGITLGITRQRGFNAQNGRNQTWNHAGNMIGIGAGLQSVAVPGLVAHLLRGTGRVNVGLGMVMTLQGVGASLSPAIGGWLAQSLSYHTAFFVLGGFALASLLLWLGFAGILRPACARASGASAICPALP